MYLCMYTCVYIYIWVCMHTGERECVGGYVYLYTHIFTFAQHNLCFFLCCKWPAYIICPACIITFLRTLDVPLKKNCLLSSGHWTRPWRLIVCSCPFFRPREFHQPLRSVMWAWDFLVRQCELWSWSWTPALTSQVAQRCVPLASSWLTSSAKPSQSLPLPIAFQRQKRSTNPPALTGAKSGTGTDLSFPIHFVAKCHL